MANTKISGLAAVTTPVSTDEFAVNQGGTTKKETRAQIHTLESGEFLQGTTGAGALDLRGDSGSTLGIRIEDAGNVGIGTESPAERLHVATGNILLDNAQGLKIKRANGDEVNAFFVDVNDDLNIGNANYDEVLIFDDSGEVIRLDGAGNVGIGTGSPTAKLDLTGGAFVQATVTTLADDATPTIAAGNLFKTGGTTAITDFDDGVVGQTICILAAHSVTITDGAPIILAGGANFAMVATDTLTLTMFDNQIWNEVSRSVN